MLSRHFRFLLLVLVVATLMYFVVFSGESNDRGFLLKTYVDELGEKHKYVVFLPYDYQPGQRRPLIMFLHGFSHNGSEGADAMAGNFGVQVWEMKRGFPFIAAIPQCRKGQAWTGAEGDKAMAIMDRVAADYQTDPDRVYITGVSSGGSGVFSVVERYPERFAAAVPFCGVPGENVVKLVESRVPIWNFYNDGDEPSRVEVNRLLRQRLFEAGASPIMTEYQRKGHNCWTFGYRCVGMYEWLLEHSLSIKRRKTEPYRLLSTEEILASWRTLGESAWSGSNDHALLCEETDFGQPGYLISPMAYHACEFHLDVYIDTLDTECQLRLLAFGENGSIEGYTFHLPFSDTGGGVWSIRRMVGLLRSIPRLNASSKWAAGMIFAFTTTGGALW